MARALDQFAELVTDGAVPRAVDLDWSRIGYEHTARARSTWGRKYAPEGARVRLTGVKSCLRTAWRLGQINGEQLQRALDLPKIGGRLLPAGRALTDQELAALFAVCAADPGLIGPRDAAIFAMFRCGLRVGELIGLDLEDYRPGADVDLVRVRRAKGGKQREVYLPRSLGELVDAWVAIRGREPGPLFATVRGTQGERLAEATVRSICRRRAKEAGIVHFSPHDFRRTTATNLHDAGVQIADIADVLGHASVLTTQRYLRHDRDQAKRRAAALLKGPC